MRTFTVRSSLDQAGSGLTLRQAVNKAQKIAGGAKIEFAEDVTSVTLSKTLKIPKGSVIIDGDNDDDGIADVILQGPFTGGGPQLKIGGRATVTLEDLTLFGGSSAGQNGTSGLPGEQIVERAANGADGDFPEQGTFTDSASEQADWVRRAAEAREMDFNGRDGRNGRDGQDGTNGAPGGDAIGGIENLGDLTLVRVGFAAQSAFGGDGGDGGLGGRGQSGGNGGQGSDSFAAAVKPWNDATGGFFVDGGHGGDGGDGGDGGAGGVGGRGGDAAAAVMNRPGATLNLVDTVLGGRLPSGLSGDRFESVAQGGNGGLGGDGGIAGEAGNGGHGGDDFWNVAVTVDHFGRLPEQYNPELRTGVFYTVSNSSGTPIEYQVGADGPKFVRRVEEILTPSSATGDGGDGGNGGAGGDAGLNGAGGDAAPIINYGTITGNAARGTVKDVMAGQGEPKFSRLPVATPGQAQPGQDAGTSPAGRPERALAPAIDVRGTKDPSDPTFDRDNPENNILYTWNPGAFGAGGGPFGAGITVHPNLFIDIRNDISLTPFPDLDRFDMTPEDGVDGIDGQDGAAGTDGARGVIGQARSGVYTKPEGSDDGLDQANGLVYLTGLRQSDETGAIEFNIVRVGDTSGRVVVRYAIEGAGENGVSEEDFARPGQLTGKVVFKSLDLTGQVADETGAGVKSVKLNLLADGVLEGTEGLKVTLKSKGALGTSTAQLDVIDGDLRLTEGNAKRLLGNKRDDALIGSDRDQVLNGKGGKDFLSGLGGDDKLSGGGGNDLLRGGKGDDVLNGGGGRDVLSGGAGQDRFVFARKAGADTITDFGEGDVIDLSAYASLRFRDLSIERQDTGTLVDFGRGSVLLDDTLPRDLDRDAFDFA